MVATGSWRPLATVASVALVSRTLYAEAPRPVTVTDMINMTEIGLPWDGYLGKDTATFSPDEQHFVVVTRRGNLAENGNTYVLLLFAAGDVERLPVPQTLATITSLSNAPAISDLRWLDNATVSFLASKGSDHTILETVQIDSRSVTTIATAATDLLSYDMTPDRRTMVYATQGIAKSFFDQESDQNGLVISNQLVSELLTDRTFDDSAGDRTPLRIFAKDQNAEPQLIVTPGYRPMPAPLISVSPDGRHIILWASMDREKLPPAWRQYKSAVGPDVYLTAVIVVVSPL